jgi:hypothetical protein
MSTTADEGVNRRFVGENLEEIYDAISHELSEKPSGYIDIEFLPKEYQLASKNVFFLKEANCLAVHKLRVVQAFIVARQILNRHLDGSANASPAEVWKATNVMLLLDSEHLTAANTRKRLLLRQSLVASERKLELENDMFFVNSLLSSHLNRHTKSPVLWSHKHWLLRQCIEAKAPVNLVHDFESIIYVAAERHPMNYYAWTYARDLFSSRLKANANWDAERDEEFTKMMTTWCRTHHNDTSGWSFLLFLAIRLPQQAPQIFTQTARVVQMYRWRGEAVWNFLRNLVLVPGIRDNSDIRQCFADLWHHVRQDVQDDSMRLDAKVLDRAAAWTKISEKRT